MAFEVEYFTLDSTQSLNRYVFLTEGVPVSGSNVVMDIVGGTAQYYSGTGYSDFGVDGTRVKWNDATYNLYNSLALNDRIRIIYDRS